MMNPLNYDIDAIAKDKQRYPDDYLIKAIHGMFKSLPPVIAMAAGQKRKDLMTAMQGAKAKQELGAGKVSDKVVAELSPEESGLAALPAQNLAGMDETVHAAGGGIIAFDGLDGSTVPPTDGPNGPLTIDEMQQLMSGKGPKRSEADTKKAIAEQNASISSALGAPSRALQSMKDWMYSSPSDKILAKAQAGRLTQADLTPPTTPNAVSQADALRNDPYRSAPAAATPPGGVAFDQTAGGNPAVAALSDKKQAGASGVGKPGAGAAANAAPGQAPQDSGIAAAYKDFMSRSDPFAELGDTKEQHAQKIKEAKDQGLGSFLMAMGAKVMRHVGPLGAAGGEGVEAGLPHLEASQKVVRDLDNNREQFLFNKAKATELRAQGNIEAALKYEQANTDLMYKTGQLAVEHEKNAMMAPYYGSMASFYGSGKGKNPNELTLDQAAKDFATAIKDGNMKRNLAAMGITDALKYRQYMNTGIPPLNVSSTIPQGAQTLQLPG